MKKQHLIPLMVLPIVLGSCNSNGHISRNVFKKEEFSKVQAIHQTMKTAQTTGEDPNKQTTLFNNGSAYFRYNLTSKGTMRLDDLSFHKINVELSAGYKLSWNLDKEFLKVEGEQETCYFVKGKDNKYYQCHSNIVDGQPSKVKNEITSDVTDAGGYKNYVVDTITHYCSVDIPFVFTITSGVTGEQVNPYELTNFQEYPDKFFDTNNYNTLVEISKKYKEENKGYYLDMEYGTNDNTTICFSMKGKLNANDFHETAFRQGTINVDSFFSFKDNFISQFEVIFDANTINKRDRFNTNLNSHIYVSQETNKNDCVYEEINVDEYGKDPEDPENKIIK